jgi:hypothetical protein
MLSRTSPNFSPRRGRSCVSPLYFNQILSGDNEQIKQGILQIVLILR